MEVKDRHRARKYHGV